MDVRYSFWFVCKCVIKFFNNIHINWLIFLFQAAIDGEGEVASEVAQDLQDAVAQDHDHKIIEIVITEAIVAVVVDHVADLVHEVQ